MAKLYQFKVQFSLQNKIKGQVAIEIPTQNRIEILIQNGIEISIQIPVFFKTRNSNFYIPSHFSTKQGQRSYVA